MSRPARHLGRAGARITSRRAAVALLIGGAAVCLAVGGLEATAGARAESPRTPTTEHPTAVVPRAAVEPAAAAEPGPRHDRLRRVRPTGVTIASIGVRSTLVRLGLQPGGTVEVPSDPDRAGWFAPGTVPGQPGSAVVLGHVDSTDGPAVFARLAELRRGAIVRISLSDGTQRSFRVQGVRTYPNADFPARRVYRGRPGRRLLTLVTCGGTYDRAHGGYQSNVVVWTRAT